jgi:hypothetical protein
MSKNLFKILIDASLWDNKVGYEYGGYGLDDTSFPNGRAKAIDSRILN